MIAKHLRVKRLNENAILPTRGTPHSAGLDLYASHQAVIPAKGQAVVHTDISVAVPEGHYGRVAPRSGLALNHGLDIGGGVIDCDYRGEICLIMFNFSDKDYSVNYGDRLAQLVIEKISMMDVVEVESLDNTERGSQGFGSTGINS